MSAVKRAYVLVELEPGREKEFGEDLVEMMESAKNEGCKSPNCGIKKVDFVYGTFDVVLILEGEPEDVENVVLRLRTVPHIRKTETLLCFEKMLWQDLGARLT
jgi:hypothetical protein